MDSFSFVISDKASDDLNRIYVYIANVLFSVDSAKRQIKRLYVAIHSLEEMPERYSLVDFEPEKSGGVRRMVVDRYSVYYCITDDKVLIVRILDNRMNIASAYRK